MKVVFVQVFSEDFSLCLMLGDILDDPILSGSAGDMRVSVYGGGEQHRSSRLSSMHLQIAEGHVIGEVS